MDGAAFLKHYNLEHSMSRRWNCHDNAVAESFFNLLKRERIRRKTYRMREKARQDVFDDIEMFHNPKRKHVRNGMLSPVEFERRHNSSPMASTKLGASPSSSSAPPGKGNDAENSSSKRSRFKGSGHLTAFHRLNQDRHSAKSSESAQKASLRVVLSSAIRPFRLNPFWKRVWRRSVRKS